MVDRKKKDNAVLVIGLGRFGAATAGELDRLDREVLAVDSDMELVQKWSERVTHTVQADVTKIEALQQIGAQEFSVAVVAVGSSIEASVLITANLVDLGIPEIWAKAISRSHGQILEREQPENHQNHADDCREDRSLDRDVGKNHGRWFPACSPRLRTFNRRARRRS